ncbi:MAG: hypothetical protein JO356_21645 [Acidobacteria bacterium]|nr:hypothetical protein [Acidobacteriota bacterium]
MQFEDGYTSEQLAQTLDYVLRSQDAFLTPISADGDSCKLQPQQRESAPPLEV